MRDGGKTYQAIADIMGVSPMTIYGALNPLFVEKRRLYNAEYQKTHKEEIRLYNVEYRKDHKEEIRLYQAEYYKVHEEEIRFYSARYYETHKGEKRLYGITYYETHKEKRRLYDAEYRKTHAAQYAAYTAARKALIAGATIGDLGQIQEIYRIAREEPKVRCYLCGKLIPMGDRTVDHIFPVSKGGAHRPSTLAVVHKHCNEEKAARTPEEIGLLL